MKTKILVVAFIAVTTGVLVFKQTKNVPPSDLRDALNSGVLSDLESQYPDSKSADMPLPQVPPDKTIGASNTGSAPNDIEISCGSSGTLAERIKDCRKIIGKQARFCGSKTAIVKKLWECKGSYTNRLLFPVWFLVTRTQDKEVWLDSSGGCLWAFDSTTNPRQFASALPRKEVCGNFREEYFGEFRMPSYNDIKRAGLLDYSARDNKWFRFFKPQYNWYVTLDNHTIKIPRVNEPYADTICMFDAIINEKIPLE